MSKTDLTRPWADLGTTAPITDIKYDEGWVVEIPTFENFNYVLNGIDNWLLKFHSDTLLDWLPNVEYAIGAQVRHNGLTYTCLSGPGNVGLEPGTGATISANSGTVQVWKQGGVVSPVGAAPILGIDTLGEIFEHHGEYYNYDAFNSVVNSWTQNQASFIHSSASIYLGQKDYGLSKKGITISNFDGQLYLTFSNSSNPNNAIPGGTDTYKIIHEGNLPSASVSSVVATPDTIALRSNDGSIKAKDLYLTDPSVATGLLTHMIGINGVVGENKAEAIPLQEFASIVADAALQDGSVIAWTGVGEFTAPYGWVLANGALLDKLEYPHLYQALGNGAQFGQTSTHFYIPDTRGLFLRGLDSGAGLDGGRTLGSIQSMQPGEHQHDLQYAIVTLYSNASVSATPVAGYAPIFAYNPDPSTGSAGVDITELAGGSGGLGAVAAESRPVNLSVKYIIKATLV